ncbi:energy transducer TonB [Luteimonas panaciterrae]|uniref:energy transducer TonB n=1 Tax=Luteimonas panaciterrae TaxID=363885 RepID=UPI001CFA4D11|nr:energy transducer TonB [Luteimonas panaciterrae]
MNVILRDLEKGEEFREMKRLWFGVCLMVLASVVMAGGTRLAMRKLAESSTQVTGTIHIAPDGSVHDYALDKSERLSPGIRKLIADNVPNWRFQMPQEAEPSTDRQFEMSLLLTARKNPDADSYSLRIRAANFRDKLQPADERITATLFSPPKYPPAAVRMNIQGTVYVVLRIDRQGKVRDAFAEQVNLTVLGTENEMNKARGMLAQSALEAARGWTFKVPTKGEGAHAELPTLRMPISYHLSSNPEEAKDKDGYGKWETYIPGPRMRAPWVAEDLGAPDALLANQVYDLSSRTPRLLTSLDQG